MTGYIKAYRLMLDNPIVCKDSDHIAVWMYLLLNATHTQYAAMFNGQKIMLQPGQLITGRKSISEKFNISESKVQRILKLFESEQQIEQQTGNKNRLISILSWHLYQSSEQQNEQQLNNNRTTTEQQVNTNKNVKNVNNVKKDKKEYIYYLEHVKMTEEEYNKLLDKMSESEREDYMDRFNVWITGQSKTVQKNRNAYLSILNWFKRDNENPKGKVNALQDWS